MKKIFVLAISSISAYVTFAGYAWFSSEINAILVSSGFPSKYRNLESPIKLYGSFNGTYWTPPYAKVSYTTGEVTTENESSISVNTFAELNNYGKYNPSVSLAHYQDNCKSYVTDEFGQQYMFFDENVAAFYTKYETMNLNSVTIAFDQLKTKFQLWISSLRSQTGGLSYDASELADKVKEIDDALKKSSERIADVAKEVEQRVADFNQSIQEAKQHLANVSNDAVLNAQDLINGCVSDFNSFISILKEALEGGEGWKEGAENAYSTITESEQKILDAIEALEPYLSEPDVSQARNTLILQANTITNIKTGLRSAINNGDKSAAQGILNSARHAGIINSKKAMQRIANAEKTYQSQKRMLNTLQLAAIGTIEYIKMLEREMDSIRDDFSTFVIDTMDNFHEIGAFLCSTNSMEYMNWRKSNNFIGDMTKSEIERWIVVSMQEPLFRNMKDQAEYQSITKMTPKSGNGYYDNIMRFLSSSCFMTYYDLETSERFESTYQSSPFLLGGFRGFKQERVLDNMTGNYTTNWSANNITAPVNWADGTSITVENGKFASASHPWHYNGTNFVNRYIQVGYSPIVAEQTSGANNDGLYYVECDLTDKTAKVYKTSSGGSLPQNTQTKIYVKIGEVENNSEKNVYHATPIVYIWED